MRTRFWTPFAAVFCVALCAGPAPAINVVIDYAYDSTNFFGSGNPDGASAGIAARNALDAAAEFFSDILDDSFAGGEIPSRVNSGATPGGYFEWEINFTHPSTGASQALTTFDNGINNFVIFAGARSLGGSTLGIGGPGGFQYAPYNSSGEVDTSVLFYSDEIADINAGIAEFEDGFIDRGETSGFAGWGGAVTFDTGANWHYDHTTTAGLGSAENDFYSVALHELAHALGWGVSSEWSDLISGSEFTGPTANHANGGLNASVSGGHWANGVSSTVFGELTPQETALDPSIQTGTRKLMTTLDVAAMVDIGWEVSDLDVLVGDYNLDGVVDAGDYTLWRDSVGSGEVIGTYAEWKANFAATHPEYAGGAPFQSTVPEPAAGGLLAVLSLLVACRAKRLS